MESAIETSGFNIAEVRTALQVREWIKSLKSGGKISQLAEEAGLTEALFTSLVNSVGGYQVGN